jgi:hypothetical protein
MEALGRGGYGLASAASPVPPRDVNAETLGDRLGGRSAGGSESGIAVRTLLP